jgi:hypothetical protein
MRIHLNGIWCARLCTLLISVLHGVGFTEMKIMYKTMPASTASAIVAISAAALFLPFILKLRKDGIASALVLSFWNAVGAFGASKGLQYSTSGIVAFVNSCAIIVCPFIAWIENRYRAASAAEAASATLSTRAATTKQMHKFWVVCLATAFAFAGVGVLVFVDTKVGAALNWNLLWPLLQPFGFGINIHYTSTVVERIPEQYPAIIAVQVVTMHRCVFIEVLCL